MMPAQVYRFDVTHNATGTVSVRWGEHKADSERALARKLVEAGAPDGAVQGGRQGKVDWTARSLHDLAASTITEGDKGFTRGIYAPWPVRDLHPALAAAVARARQKQAEKHA